jgi:hypothetical protein
MPATVLSRIMVMTVIGVLDWMIGFIDTSYTPLRSTVNHSAIADVQTLQFSVTHTLVFSVFARRILATDLYQSHCNCSTHKGFFLQPGSFLAISSQSSSTADSRDSRSSSRYIASGRTHRRHRFHRYLNNTSVVAYSLPRKRVCRNGA